MNSDFKELLQCLNDRKVHYLIIGGYAVSYYSEPRYTKDLDLFVEPSATNSRRLRRALDEFGAPVDNLERDDFAIPGLLYVFGLPPSRVDILNRVKGVRFAGAWQRRKVVEIDGVKMPFVSLKDLKRMKASMKRPQDLIDLKKLQRL